MVQVRCLKGCTDNVCSAGIADCIRPVGRDTEEEALKWEGGVFLKSTN